jgi:3-oxoadipate enol-lactonase
VNLAYRSDGTEDKPALVLASSLGTTWELWDAQLPALVSHFRVLRYDLPGHGRSEVTGTPVTVEGLAGGVVELLDRLELERVSFGGVSLGGAVGMALALRHPERVDRLALACTSAFFGPPAGWYERAALVRERGTTAIADTVLARWFTERFRREHVVEAMRFRTMLEAIADEGYALCCEAIARWDVRGRLDEIRAPTLVIAGESDVATPPSDARFLTETIPGAELVVLPAAAHLANVEQPELFSRALLEHLTVPVGEEVGR